MRSSLSRVDAATATETRANVPSLRGSLLTDATLIFHPLSFFNTDDYALPTTLVSFAANLLKTSSTLFYQSFLAEHRHAVAANLHITCASSSTDSTYSHIFDSCRLGAGQLPSHRLLPCQRVVCLWARRAYQPQPHWEAQRPAVTLRQDSIHQLRIRLRTRRIGTRPSSLPLALTTHSQWHLRRPQIALLLGR